MLFTKSGIVMYVYKSFNVLDIAIPALEICVCPVVANRHKVTLLLIVLLSSVQKSKHPVNYLQN